MGYRHLYHLIMMLKYTIECLFNFSVHFKTIRTLSATRALKVKTLFNGPARAKIAATNRGACTESASFAWEWVTLVYICEELACSASGIVQCQPVFLELNSKHTEDSLAATWAFISSSDSALKQRFRLSVLSKTPLKENVGLLPAEAWYGSWCNRVCGFLVSAVTISPDLSSRDAICRVIRTQFVIRWGYLHRSTLAQSKMDMQKKLLCSYIHDITAK